MYILIPGRHHLISQFQFEYLQTLIEKHRSNDLKGLVFAVTSANHSGTKRNPIPFYLRALIIQELAKELQIPVWIYGIDDVGNIPQFASYTLKQIQHQSDQQVQLQPKNTLVVCSTPVLLMYRELGFDIEKAELEDESRWTYHTDLPWKLVEDVCFDDTNSPDLAGKVHASTRQIWELYNIRSKVRKILQDPIIGADGDLTESRDYTSYVRQMDEIAEIKYRETAPHIQPGVIGDIGCAVGSWIRQACDDDRLHESDFYGIELARQLYDICLQRKHNQEFRNPNVFFAQKNAVNEAVFLPGSMNTIHTSSLTHEIASYGSISDVEKFIHNRFLELQPGGIWINRDVIGPEEGDKNVVLWLNDTDGLNAGWDTIEKSDLAFGEKLNALSTYSRFLRFAQDFRAEENDRIEFEILEKEGRIYARLALKDAAEYMLTKDYTDNWYSEMHERFCFWSLRDWKEHLEKAGFRILDETKAYTNPWIAENRWEGKVELLDDAFLPLPAIPTNALILAVKQ
jgi:hypothetical protein